MLETRPVDEIASQHAAHTVARALLGLPLEVAVAGALMFAYTQIKGNMDGVDEAVAGASQWMAAFMTEGRVN